MPYRSKKNPLPFEPINRERVSQWDKSMFARCLADKREMHLAFGIWQGLSLAVTGVLLGRADFDDAWNRWEACPKRYPMMTIALNAEEHLITATQAGWSGIAEDGPPPPAETIKEEQDLAA